MKLKSGLWIDHRKAVIVNINDEKVEKMTIESTVEKQPGRIKGKRSLPFENQLVLADDTRERIFRNRLKKYYNIVSASIKGAESVLIFGPGEAKIEMKKFMIKNNPAKMVIEVLSADKMTDQQIMAKIIRYFRVKKPPVVFG